MTADLLYIGALVSAVLFSGVVLLRQFADGDLTERQSTGGRRRRYPRLVSRSRGRAPRPWPTRGVSAVASLNTQVNTLRRSA